jgi:hypothetical protein
MNKLTFWTAITCGISLSGALVAMDDKKNDTTLRITATKEELYKHVLMTDRRYERVPDDSGILSFLTSPMAHTRHTNYFIPREAFEYANIVMQCTKSSDEDPFDIHGEELSSQVKGWSQFCSTRYERIKKNTATTQEKEDFLVIGGSPLSSRIKTFHLEEQYPHFLAQVAALEKTIKLEDFNADRLD